MCLIWLQTYRRSIRCARRVKFRKNIGYLSLRFYITSEKMFHLPGAWDTGRPVKYLVYVKGSTDKYDSRKGLLYDRYVKLSYNFKNRDLAKLAKVID